LWIGFRQHGFAFGVEALTLRTALSISTIATASTAPTSTAFTSRGAAVATAFRATLTGLTTGTVAIAAAAFTTFRLFGSRRWLNRCGRRWGVAREQALDPAKEAFLSGNCWFGMGC
jgi:hypothetical protein